MAMVADIRIASETAEFKFEEIEHGLLNASGIYSILKLNISALKSFILSGVSFNNLELNQLGAFTLVNKSAEDILMNINKQSCIARSQTKCALNLHITEANQSEICVEKLLKATLFTDDYKKEKDFTNLRNIKLDLSTNQNNLEL
jgi:enoyl-CoA hydratase/carnithine racemase